MAAPPTVDQFNALIAAHPDQAGNAIRQLKSSCQQDDNGETPLNAAIQSGNDEITRRLAESDEAISHFPTIDDNLQRTAAREAARYILTTMPS